MTYKAPHQAFHELSSRESFTRRMAAISKPTSTHKVKGGSYIKNGLNMIYWNPTQGNKALICLNDASGKVWKQIRAEV